MEEWRAATLARSRDKLCQLVKTAAILAEHAIQ